MSKILIVTGSDYTDQVYQAFSDVLALGHQLYLLSDGSFEPHPGIFEKHFVYDLRKTGETLDYIKSQDIRFDAVTIKTSEWLTPLTALLAKQYGCIGNDPVTAFNCRSKYHMRRELEKGGVPIPKFELCKNYAELLQAIEQIGIPCVAKPVGGNASYGTFLIMNAEDMRNLKQNYESSVDYLRKKAVTEDVFAFSEEEMDLIGIRDHVDMVTDYLVEEYMDGPEISVDAIVQNGRVTIFGVEDQIRMKPPYVLQIAARLPYVCDSKREAEIYDLICQTVKAVGLRNSATHTEIIFTKDGPKIVEIGCRIGGDDLHDTILEATGYNLMYESIMVALGIKRHYEVRALCHTMMQFVLPEKEGVIEEIFVDESLKKDPNVYNMALCSKKGDKVGPPPYSFDYLAYVGAKGSSPAEAQTNLESALRRISFTIR